MTLMWMTALLLSAPTEAEASPRIAVMPTQLEVTVADQVPGKMLEEAILTAVQQASGAEVIGADDLATVLGFEAQRDLLGCDEVACMAEIVGALHVQRVVRVRIARLGEEWTLASKCIRVEGSPVVEARDTRFLRGDAVALLRAAQDSVRSLFVDSARGPRAPAAPTEPATARPIDITDPASYEQFKTYVSKKDWDRYRASDEARAGAPLSDWIYAQNQESTGMAVAEAVACGAMPGSLVVGVASDFEVAGSVFLLGLIGCVVLSVADALDVGEVKQFSPPPPAATLPVAVGPQPPEESVVVAR